MKIGYVTTYDPSDVHAWSGLGLHIAQALERQGFDLVRIGPLRAPFNPVILGKFLWASTRGLKYKRHRSRQALRSYAHEVRARIRELDIDLLFSPGSLPLAYLQSDIPVVFWTDAPFSAMVNFYPSMTNLTEDTLRDGHEAEQSALTNCQMAIYSSAWAAQSAIDHYQVNPEKIKVVPFGANLASIRTASEVAAIVSRRKDQPLQLLFIGVEWDRKGGDQAVAVAENLIQHGISLELNIVGCQVPTAYKRPFVKEHGYLSKAKSAEMSKLEELLTNAHFLLQPSRAECSAVVVAEANSFGVPVFSSDVGAFPTLVKNGFTGFCFSLPAFAENASREIMRLRQDNATYEKIALNAFSESTEKLNWNYAGRQVKILLESIPLR